MLLRPASPGTGVIAGGGVRALLELGGVARRPHQVPGDHQPDQHGAGGRGRACSSLRRPEDIARLRGKTVREVLGIGPAEAAARPPAAAAAEA